MSITNLCRLGGSVMRSVPRRLLDQLNLHAGSQVDHGRLIVEPAKLLYSLEGLLAQCDTTADMSAGEREWLNADPIGRELL